MNRFQKIKLYFVYWISYIVLFSLIQGLPTNDFWRSLSNECYSVLPKILFVLIIVEFVIPLLLFKKKIILFIFAYTFSILFFAFFQRLIDNYIIIAYYLTHWKTEPLFSVPVYLYNVIKLQFVVTVPITIKLIYYIVEEKNKVQQILSEKLQAELYSLRNQVHPHFLFNVLNSLYSKILSKSDDAADIVLRVSDLLRFSIYETNNKTVLLEKDIKYLDNYIALQKLRFDNRLELTFVIKGINEKQFIEPFLILPFVENSFKYSLADPNCNAWINILITVEGEFLLVVIRNSIPEDLTKCNSVKNSFTGIGITNVKRRLELLYPNEHTLSVKSDLDSFMITLKIKVSYDN